MDTSKEAEVIDFNKINANLEYKNFENIQKLEEIAKTVNAEKLFTSVIMAMRLAPEDEISEATHGTVPAKIEMLAYYLYPFFGLSDNKNVLPTQVWFCQEFLDHSLMANAFSIYSAIGDSPADRLARMIEGQAIVVRGSAYPEQTTQEIIGIQGHFDKWFERHTGISPSRAQEVLFEIFNSEKEFPKNYMEQVYAQANELIEEWKRIKKVRPNRRTNVENNFLSVFGKRELAFGFGFTEALSNLGYDNYPVDLKNLPNITPDLTETEIKGLINLIGMTTDKRKGITEIIEMRQNPLYVLPDQRVIIVDPPNALDALWDAFDTFAKTNSKFWDGKYATRKGAWLEDKTIEYLEKIFPKSSIYKSLSYPDLSKPSKSIAELDIAIDWSPFIILIEAKAKQFRLESQLGDIGRLRTDIKKNVEEAFEQARRSADYIANTHTPEFIEKNTGRKLVIDKAKIKRTFLLTLSLHNLAGLATTLAVFQDIGLFRYSEFPFSVSIADFEFIAEFCDGPDVFLNYIEKRLEVQKLDIDFRGDELDLLSAYLTTRLQKQQLWERDDEKFSAFILTGWSAVFDDWVWYRQGLISQKPEISLDIPQEIKEVLELLRSTNNDQSRWIAFNLLSMSDSVLNAISGLMIHFRSRQLDWGDVLQGSKVVDDVLIVSIGGLGIPISELIRRVKIFAKSEKIRQKVNKVLGFAVSANQTARPFEYIEFLESD